MSEDDTIAAGCLVLDEDDNPWRVISMSDPMTIEMGLFSVDVVSVVLDNGQEQVTKPLYQLSRAKVYSGAEYAKKMGLT